MGNNEMVGRLGGDGFADRRSLAVCAPGHRAAAAAHRQLFVDLGASSRATGKAPAPGRNGMFLQNQVALKPLKQTVYRNFEKNWMTLCAPYPFRCEVLLNTVAVNLKDFPPWLQWPTVFFTGRPRAI